MEINTSYRQYRPSLTLADKVECFWALEASALPGRVERLIPGGRVELIFNLGDAIQWMNDEMLLRGVMVMGQRDRLFFCRPVGVMRLFGVRFRPGCLAAFSPTPLHLLLDQLLPAEELFGLAVGEVFERVCEAKDDACRVREIETWLCGMLSGVSSAPVLFALDTMRCRDGVSVEGVCEEVGWGYKRLERAFLKEVGYTPKGYSRLVRFNKAMRRIGGDDSLTTVGHACGYYDQAHFIKDFARFAGMTPGKFRVDENLVAELLIRNQAV